MEEGGGAGSVAGCNYAFLNCYELQVGWSRKDVVLSSNNVTPPFPILSIEKSVVYHCMIRTVNSACIPLMRGAKMYLLFYGGLKNS